MEYSHFLVSHRTTAELSFCQIFNQHTYHLQPTNYFIVLHGTGLNVPVLKRLISIIQPCPRYKVKCPCVGHTHTIPTYHPTKLSLSTQFSTEFSLPHLGNNTPIQSYYFFFRFVPTTKQRSSMLCLIRSSCKLTSGG